MTSSPNNIHLDTFLEMLIAERDVAINTTRAYRQDLLALFQFIAPLNCLEIDQTHLSKYLSTLNGSAQRSTTLARRCSSLRQFFAFLMTEGIRTSNPMEAINTPKIVRQLPKILSEEEIQRLLTVAAQGTSPEDYRLYTMLELLYATGLRVSELVCLPMVAVSRNHHQDTLKKTLQIKGKGGKERLVILNPPAIHALLNYFKVRGHFIKKYGAHTETWLFPSHGCQGYITRQRFAQLLKVLALKAGIIPEKVSPHTVRHAFATHLLRHGADLLTIQKLLGHADLSTTQIYTHVAKDHLKKLVDQHHPLSSSQKLQQEEQKI